MLWRPKPALPGAALRGAVPALAVAVLLAPSPVRAIPVFARIYDEPCGACHTVFPQLNPDGERFRANGLHGLTPAIRPIRVAPELEAPGTLPLALTLAAGGDFIKVDVPGAGSTFSVTVPVDHPSVGTLRPGPGRAA